MSIPGFFYCSSRAGVLLKDDIGAIVEILPGCAAGNAVNGAVLLFADPPAKGIVGKADGLCFSAFGLFYLDQTVFSIKGLRLRKGGLSRLKAKAGKLGSVPTFQAGKLGSVPTFPTFPTFQ